MSEQTKTVVTLQINENATANELREQALQKFGKAKAALSEMQGKLAVVIIKDEATFAIANDVISQAKEMQKKVEAKRVLLKAPALEYGKAIDAAAKEMNLIIDEPIKRAEAKKLVWLQEQERKRNEELMKAEQERALAEKKKLDEIDKVKNLQAKLESYGKTAIQELGSATTNDHLKEIFTKYIKNAPQPEYWGVLVTEALNMIEFIKNAGKVKKNIINYQWQLDNATTGTQKDEINTLLTVEKGAFYDMAAKYDAVIKEQKEAVQEVIVEAVINAEEEKAVIMDTTLDLKKQTTGLRKTWEYMLDEMKDVPVEWTVTTLNRGAIDAWLKENKNTLNPNGEVVKGIKFFQKTGLSGKS